MNTPVLLDFDAETGIARITFNRPEVLNAADVPLARGFLEPCGALPCGPACAVSY